MTATREPQPRSGFTAAARLGRVLIVDDNQDHRSLLAATLKHAATEIVLAEDGRSGANTALEEAREDRAFDLVIMDLSMPVMTGHEAIELLRGRGYTGAVIALTARIMAGERERALESGFDAFLSKPFDRHDLVAKLQHVLDAQRNVEIGTR